MGINRYTIFIISDGTGETASQMVRAGLVQYSKQDINIVKCKNVRTETQVEPLIDDVVSKKGIIVYTVVSKVLRNYIADLAKQKNILAIDLLGPLLTNFDAYLGNSVVAPQAGLLHTVDEKYFKRIEAIEYTVKHDDGKAFSALNEADIILVGISRTSKTPLSIFLSYKGIKVANIPLVLNSPLPEQLSLVDQRKVVGLIIDADTLLRIRRKRLEKFGQDPGSEYASREHVFKEIEYANELFRQNRRWPVFNVTDRALEETAAEIVRIVATRMDIPFDYML
ncbi:MAG: phosphate kinase [Bdellovibrionales bacterium RBG_16_40_8]|nr:MAG: phosphate kinase [Bdellovibrionales bacterium RBG_16_40_8]